jgi:hypothetical protein
MGTIGIRLKPIPTHITEINAFSDAEKFIIKAAEAVKATAKDTAQTIATLYF